MLVIRADGNNIIGMGHIMRCLSIAKELSSQNISYCFLVSKDCDVEIFKSMNIPYDVLQSSGENGWDSNEVASWLINHNCKSILIDTYRICNEDFYNIKKSNASIFYIDDFAEVDGPIDCIINYNFEASKDDYKSKINKNLRLCLGPEYFPLREEFILGKKSEIRKDVKRVLITTGSTDPKNITYSFLDFLSKKYKEIKFVTIVGKFFSEEYVEKLNNTFKDCDNVELLKWGQNMSSLFYSCDLVISPGSTTIFEALSMNVPCISYEFVHNQYPQCAAMEELDLVPYIGSIESLQESNFIKLEEVFNKELDYNQRLNRKNKFSKFFDGKGTSRIVKEVCMQKVMILGAGPLQVPAIKKSKELGLYVIVCDYDEHAVGFQFADEHYLISTIDQDAVLEKAKELNVDFVMTSTSDAPVRTAAYVCEKLGLPVDLSYEDAVCATVKSAMRERLGKFNVPIPKYYVCKTWEDFLSAVLSFKSTCIIKPSDSAASRGVMQVNVNETEEKLRGYYEYCISNSRNKIVMVEELMTGAEVSVECFIVNKNVDIIAITDKIVTELPYFVELGHSEQSSLNEETKEQIRKIAKDAINAIGIINGVSHVEVKLTEEGPKIVEIAARLGGDFITSKLVPLSTGVDMVGNSILLSLHKPVDLTRRKNQGSAIKFLAGKTGIIKKIEILPEIYKLPGFQEVELYVKEGDKVSELHSSNDRLGHVIATGCNSKDALENADMALEKILITIE